MGQRVYSTNVRCSQAVERIKKEIAADFPGKTATVEWMLLDLGSFRSTKDFANAFREKNLPLHLLINNAGIAWLPLSKAVIHTLWCGCLSNNFYCSLQP